jgi:hypothetical protein
MAPPLFRAARYRAALPSALRGWCVSSRRNRSVLSEKAAARRREISAQMVNRVWICREAPCPAGRYRNLGGNSVKFAAGRVKQGRAITRFSVHLPENSPGTPRKEDWRICARFGAFARKSRKILRNSRKILEKGGSAKLREFRRICPKVLPERPEKRIGESARALAHLVENSGGLGGGVSKYSPWGGLSESAGP